MSAMTHGRSAIPPILIQASDPDLRLVEERLSFPFRPTYVPSPTFFMITLSVRLNGAALLTAGLCGCAPRSHETVAEPLLQPGVAKSDAIRRASFRVSRLAAGRKPDWHTRRVRTCGCQ
jgi:hypothetical protein